MELINSSQANFEDLKNNSFDVFITSCGYDWRSIHLLKQINITCSKKIAFQNGNQYNPLIKDYLVQNGFFIYDIDSNSITDFNKIYTNLYCNNPKFDYKIIIDYSSMPQAVYGGFIHFLTCLETEIKNFTIYFSFTQGNYLQTNLHLHESSPSSIFSDISGNNNKKKALILGVNQNELDTKRIIDYFKPEQCFLFLPKQPFEEKLYKKVVEMHQSFKNKISQCQIFSYLIDNIGEIDRELTCICHKLRLDHKIILMSMGPESFSLASYLLYSRYPDIDIWHTMPSKSELKPIDIPIIQKTVFTSEGDDY